MYHVRCVDTTSKKGARQLGFATTGQVLVMIKSLRHAECHGKSTVVSESDLILVPRLPRTRLMRFAQLMSFQVKGLSHESRGVGPEKGKASEPADLS